MSFVKMIFTAFLLVGAQGDCAALLDASEEAQPTKVGKAYTLKLLPQDGSDQLAAKLKKYPYVEVLDLSDNTKITLLDLKHALTTPPSHIILPENTPKQNILKHLACQVCEVFSGSSLYIQGLTVSGGSRMLTDPTLVRELKITNSSQFSGECLGKFPNLKLLEAGDVIRQPTFKFENLGQCLVLEEFHMTYLCGYKGDHETSQVSDNFSVFNVHPTLKKATVTFWYCETGPETTTWERKAPMLETASASSEASAAVD